MKWIQIKRKEVNDWNSKLKSTNASFFQYPYYASGYKHFFLAHPVYLKLIDEENVEKAFCTVLKIGFYPFKIGLIVRGPVILSENLSIELIFTTLKRFAKIKKYAFLRVNPDSAVIEVILKKDSAFIQRDFFPLYKGSQTKDFNVYNRPREQLLQSFLNRGRQKIKYAEEVNFSYKTIKSVEELKEVYHLFQTLEKAKKFEFRPYKSYEEIFTNGSKNDLCAVYIAIIGEEIICAAFIVKDAQSYNYLSGALVIKNFEPKNSPANKLHYLAMQDCFYVENKHHYNISYSDPSSDVYVFKNSFKPMVEEKPGYYTYIINRGLTNLIWYLQQGSLSKVRGRVRKLIRIFNP